MPVTRNENLSHASFVALGNLANSKLTEIFKPFAIPGVSIRKIDFKEFSQWTERTSYAAEMSRLVTYCTYERQLRGSPIALNAASKNPIRLDGFQGRIRRATYMGFLSDVDLYSRQQSVSIVSPSPRSVSGVPVKAISAGEVYKIPAGNESYRQSVSDITGNCYALARHRKFGFSIQPQLPTTTCQRGAFWPCAQLKTGKPFSDAEFEGVKGSVIHSVIAIRRPNNATRTGIRFTNGSSPSITVQISCTDGTSTGFLESVEIPSGKEHSEEIYPRWMVFDNMSLTSGRDDVIICATYITPTVVPNIMDIETTADVDEPARASFETTGSLWNGTICSELYNDLESFLNAL